MGRYKEDKQPAEAEVTSIRISTSLVRKAGFVAVIEKTTVRKLVDEWVTQGLAEYERSNKTKIPSLK